MAVRSSSPTLAARCLVLAVFAALSATAACGNGSASTAGGAGTASSTATGRSSSTAASSQSGGAQHTCKPPDGWANNYSGVVMKVTVTMTNGIITLSCTFDNPEVYSGSPGQTLNCASLPQFEERIVPNFHSASHGGGSVDFNVTIKHAAYHGPGSYAASDLTIEPFFFTGDTDGFGLSHYVSGAATTATVVVNADASGRLDFGSLGAEDQTLPQPNGQPWPPVRGSVTWTCRDDPSVIATPG